MKRLITDLELQYWLKKKDQDELEIFQFGNEKFKAELEGETLVLESTYEDEEAAIYTDPETLEFKRVTITGG